MDLSDRLPIVDLREKDARSHDIRDCRSQPLKRTGDNLEASAGLPCRVPTQTVCPSVESGAVPDTATMLPTLTARQNPICGSNGDPDETEVRFCSIARNP
jgi:hypothetical protein